MADRYPAAPSVWLMTDERMGDGLWAALRRLPPGSGIVFRHHATPRSERARVFARVRRIARARRLTLIVAGVKLPGAHGVLGPGVTRGLRLWAAHDRREALTGQRAGADLMVVSPIFATRTHPGEPNLGPRAALGIARGLDIPLIALGGMTARRWRRLRGFYGWAAIDAWLQ